MLTGNYRICRGSRWCFEFVSAVTVISVRSRITCVDVLFSPSTEQRRNSFIAFTANHQSLLFPVFLLQRNIQQHVFGVGYWETVERSSKEEDSNVPSTNKFDPRHVQVLMRTYQDGGAAAVLNHTGDLNKGVELPLDIEEDAEKGSKMTGLQRLRFPQESQIWNSVRKSVVDGGVLGKLGIERMKEFKVRVAPVFRSLPPYVVLKRLITH